MASQVLSFLIQGSQAQPYQVTFRKDGANLTALCTCKAGEEGTYCKHRFALLDGDVTALVGNNSQEVPQLRQWLIGTDVERALHEVREAEKAMELAKKNLTGAKKALARAMLN